MTTPSYPVSTIAKLFDLTERRVQQLATEGVIPKAMRGKYELVPSVKGYINYLKERSIGKDAIHQETYDARVRLIKAQATKLELEAGLKNGSLLTVEEVQTTWDSISACCRSVLLGLPNRLAYQLVAVKEPKEAAQLIKDAVYEALTELSTYDIEDINRINIANQSNGEESNDKPNNDAQ